MRLVVPVKHVPEPTATWAFADDLTLDRGTVEGGLSELDEYAVEQAVRLLEAGIATEVTVLTMGPDRAVDALRKALAMGAAAGVHVVDAALHGSDALATSQVLAAALTRIGFDLVLCGMASTDAELSVVPAMLAERLAVPYLGLAAALAVDAAAGKVSIRREGDAATEELSADLPAVVSVTDQSGEPRYPAFRSIMAARKKPVTTWALPDLQLTPEQVGSGTVRLAVSTLRRTPPRAAGEVVPDDGDGAARLADFLAAQGFI